jgi:4-hydroxybenzoyl-CoA thioesterase
MSRAKLQLPSTFTFQTDLEVRIADINYGGHLGNDAVLALAHETRIRFLRSLGYTEFDIEGRGIIMTDAVVIYRTEAFHGDRMNVSIAVDDVQTHTFDLLYRFVRAADGVEIARVKTGLAIFDYKKKVVAPLPDEFRRKVLSLH